MKPIIFTASVFALALGLAVSSSAVAQQRRISEADARRIALERVPGGTVEDVELENEGGREVYEVEVEGTDSREHEVVIDVTSGQIISHDIEAENDDADDDDDDDDDADDD